MLKLYNTLTRKLDEFRHLERNLVGIYVCGPTVYGPCHLGHARTWIFFDWLRRYLIFKGFKVKFVQNITDVGHLVGDQEEGEDKIEKEAKSEGKTPQKIAKFYEESYFKDLESLNILKPSVSPRATEHILDIISFIKVLIKKKNAYEVSGNVYFDVSSFPRYGKLSGRNLKESLEETRIKKDPLKKNQADFALWLRASAQHLQKWPSPWGEGFPGWHIECSVMSEKYLGQPFDIHGSASEHIFPHHENEIAQSWGYAGKPLARYFLHSGMLLIGGQKMAKSKKNYLTIQEVFKQTDADTVKLAFMSTFWRKPFDLNENAILEARILKEKLIRAKRGARPPSLTLRRSGQAKVYESGFKEKLEEVLDDDFNTPKMLALIMENLSKLSENDFEDIEKIFGLKLESEIRLTKKQQGLVQKREKARQEGDFKEADRLRKEIENEGILIEDTPDGPRLLTD